MGRSKSTGKRQSSAPTSTSKTKFAKVKAPKKAYVKPSSSKKQSALRAIANSQVAGFLGIEKKFYDTGLAQTVLVSSAGCSGGEMDPSATSMISTPAQGDSEQNREGKRIVIKSCMINGLVSSAPQETQANPPPVLKVYVALVLDTQSNGAQLNSEDVFKNTIADATLSAVPQRNLLYAQRFRILKSEVFDLDLRTLSHVAADSFSYCGVSVPFQWYVPMDLVVNFNAGTTSSIANVIDNSLHVVAFCSSATQASYLAYNARIRFLS